MKTKTKIIMAATLMGLTANTYLIAPARAAETAANVLEVRKTYQSCRTVRQAKSTTKTTLYGVYRDLVKQEKASWRGSRPTGGHTLEVMTVYTSGGRIRAVDYREHTPSGDWSKVTTYCFRANGTLAFALAELRTFQGNVRVVDRLYYDPAGQRIRALRSLFDLNSDKRIKTAKSGFHDRKTTIYLTSERVVATVGRKLLPSAR